MKRLKWLPLVVACACSPSRAEIPSASWEFTNCEAQYFWEGPADVLKDDIADQDFYVITVVDTDWPPQHIWGLYNVDEASWYDSISIEQIARAEMRRDDVANHRCEDPLRFVFNGAFDGAAELEFVFFRPLETVGEDHSTIGPNEPRFARETTLASAPTVETVRATINFTRLLGSGLDHDGATPLLVLYDASARHVDVFTVADDELLNAEQTGVGRNRTDISGQAKPDLMQGSIPEKSYEPMAGAICHGLITILCTVWQDTDPPYEDWQIVAMAFVTSQDQGQTWQLTFEDSPVDIGWPRGREWCMQNWWPMERQPDPLEAYFVSTDYRHNPGAEGGRMYLFRATRVMVGDPWEIEPTVIVYESDGLYSEHFHTAAVVPFGENGLRVITCVGDCQSKNRIVSATREDRLYTDPGWTVQEDYHGSRRSDDWSDPGRMGNQFVGCAPGPQAGDLLIGSDLHTEQLWLIPEDDTAPTSPDTQHLYGLSLAEENIRSENFLIRTPTPELGGPYYSRYSPHSDSGRVLESMRVLYSPDGIHWAQVFAPGIKNSLGCIHGGHIYMDSFFNSAGVRRIELPRVLTWRPLEIGPGGFQRGIATPHFVSGPYGAITELSQDQDGCWLFNCDPVDPQPPCFGQVYHLSSSRFEEGREVGRIWPCGLAEDVGDMLATDVLQVRCWIMNNSRSVSAHPVVEVRDDSGPQDILCRPVYAATGKWFPVLAIDHVQFTEGKSMYMRWLTSDSTLPDDADFFVALDSVIEGAGYPGYTLPLDDSAGAGGRWCADELASITGFVCSDTWTITLAAQLPEDGWDATVGTTGEWPIATLWGDEYNYVELVAESADPDDCRLVARVVRDGALVATLESQKVYWLRGSPVLVSVADANDGGGIRMTVSAAGSTLHEASLRLGDRGRPLAVPPTEIRFSSHHGASSDGLDVRVSPMLWWGGEIYQTTYLDEATRADLLTTLSFLDPTSIPGDLNGDGCVDQADLGMLLAAYGINSNGDCDGDGDTDQADLGILLSNYGVGR
ncbi:MAG: hypothetical protein KAS72_09695 [Phycisphaerales bacterium]|nr:hypothetical protein [Phycisphaerales bacterium]